MAQTHASDRGRLERLAEEQAGLRRVATLVARGVQPDEVFAAVSNEVGRLFRSDVAGVFRFADEEPPEVVAVGISNVNVLSPGTRFEIPEGTAISKVFRTGRSARARIAEMPPDHLYISAAAQLGVVSTVASPITVEGRLWGAMVATNSEDLASVAEERLEKFTELVATAIANAEARAALRMVADEQAALRRVATLVARESPPGEVFGAVAEELGRLLGAKSTVLYRCEDDETATLVGNWGELAGPDPSGRRFALGGNNVASLVVRTARPARIDDYADATGAIGTTFKALGVRAGVGVPIIVGGRLWGAMGAAAPEPLPPDAESRLAGFAELVAIAIANVEARAELTASRARIVAAADEERRRVVRDLHDGAQQRLVHTVITLKLAQEAVTKGAEDGPPLVEEALANAEQAMAEVRDLAHGILPRALTNGGLRAGIGALCSRAPVPVELDVSVSRLPAPVEATAYFVVAEALTNMVKHSSARHADVVARIQDGTLRVEVRDDGVGGASPDGTGLVGLADRLAVLDGGLEVDSPPGGGTCLTAAIPLPRSDRPASA